MNENMLQVLKSSNPTLEIQYYLKDIAYVHPEIPSVNTSGIYDSETKKAVGAFQNFMQIPENGKIDYNTWNAIIEEEKNCRHNLRKPNKVACFPSKRDKIKPEDKGDIVYIIQIILKNFSKKYKNYPAVTITGTYDVATEKAIRTFQRLSDLPITGIVDKKTWNNLTYIYEICKIYDC